MMRGSGLCLFGGLLVGLLVGYALGRSDSREPDRLGRSVPPVARAQEPHRVLADTRPRSRVLSTHPDRTAGAAAPSKIPPDASREQQPAATDAAADAAILLARLERAAGGDLSIEVNATMKELAARHPDVHIPLDLTLALIRGGHAFHPVDAVRTFTLDELRRVVESAPSAHIREPASWRLAADSAQRFAALEGDVDGGLVLRLLQHEIPDVCLAGIYLAPAHRQDAEGAVRRVAQSERARRERVAAMEVLAGWGTSDAAQLISRAVREGSLEDRRLAAAAFRRLGPSGGAAALELLAEDGYAEDDSIQDPLVETVLVARLGGRLLDRSQSPGLCSLVIHHLGPIARADRAALDAVAPHFWEMANVVDEDDLDKLLSIAADNGHLEFVVAQFDRRSVATSRRVVALEAVLFSGDTAIPHGTLAAVVRRAVWDEALPTEWRLDALRRLVSEEGHREESYALQLRVLRDHTLPSALRSVAVEGLSDHFERDDLKTRLREIRAIWREVQESDPSSLVRAVAEKRLGDEWQ